MNIKVIDNRVTITHKQELHELIIPDHYKPSGKFKKGYTASVVTEVPVEPYKTGGVELIVDEFLSLRSQYKDENGVIYMAIQCLFLDNPQSTLRSMTGDVGNDYKYPTILTLVS